MVDLPGALQPSATSPDAKGHLVALDEMWSISDELGQRVCQFERHRNTPPGKTLISYGVARLVCTPFLPWALLRFLVVRLKINFATCRSSFSYILWLRRCTQLLCYSPKHFLKDLMRLCESGNSRTQCHSMSFEYFKLLISNFSHLKERRGSDHANMLLWSNAYCGCHANISQLARNLFCWRYMKWNTC